MIKKDELEIRNITLNKEILELKKEISEKQKEIKRNKEEIINITQISIFDKKEVK